MSQTFMVFDVESVGLQGEGFSVAWVVVQDGEVICEGDEEECEPESAAGFGSPEQQATDRRWVAENCNLHRIHAKLDTPREVRAVFWAAWLRWKKEGALLAADVAWPVEANFLRACIEDHPGDVWSGPYPLIDIASVRYALGLDPLAAVPRLPDELPAHVALNDARQSARLLIEALTLPRPEWG